MPTETAVPDSEPITDLRRRMEELEARVAALGQVVTSAAGATAWNPSPPMPPQPEFS